MVTFPSFAIASTLTWRGATVGVGLGIGVIFITSVDAASGWLAFFLPQAQLPAKIMIISRITAKMPPFIHC